MLRKIETIAAQNPSSLAEIAYDRLRMDIIDGHFLPEEKLKIGLLTERYDMGGSPIREALSRLTSDALVSKTENRGFRVSPVSKEEFTEIFEARQVIEAETLRRSVDGGGQDWEDRVAASFVRLDRTDVADTAWEGYHRSFHASILSACGSRLLLRYTGDLYDQAVRYRNLARRRGQPLRDVQAEHRRIFDSCVKHDASGAVNELLSHYRSTFESLPWPSNRGCVR